MDRGDSHAILRRFGPFSADLSSQQLLKGGIPVELEPKVWRLLAMLLEQPGRVVTYQELKQGIWPDVEVELQPSVHVLVDKLRTALGESSRSAAYIRTLRGQGYCFAPETLIQTGQVGPPPTPKPARRRFIVAAGLAGLFAGLLLAWLFLRGDGPPEGPAQYKLVGSRLTVQGKSGRLLWSYPLPGAPGPASTDSARPAACLGAALTDLDGDGRNELLYSFNSVRGDQPVCVLYCFGSEGSLWWTHTPGRPVTSVSGSRISGQHTFSLLHVLRQPRPDGGRILVVTHHLSDWPSCVVVLTADTGRTVSEYWHSGRLWEAATADLDGDGVEEILLGGTNASYRALVEDGRAYGPTLVVLDARMTGGRGPAMPGDSRSVAGVPEADETAVLLLPEPAPATPGSPPCSVSGLRVDPERRIHFQLTCPLGAEDQAAPAGSYRLGPRLEPEPGASGAPGKIKYLKNKLAGAQRPSTNSDR